MARRAARAEASGLVCSRIAIISAIVRGGGTKPVFGKSAVRVLASSTDMLGGTLDGWLWHAANKRRDTATKMGERMLPFPRVNAREYTLSERMVDPDLLFRPVPPFRQARNRK